MKKIFILICLLLLTGCNASYEITIKDNKISEKLSLVELNKELFDVKNDTGWTLREVFKAQVELSKDEFSVEDYTVKDLSNDNKLSIEYNSNKINNLVNSSVINQCYTNPSMKTEDNIVKFSTGEDFSCYEYYNNLETITIVLETNHNVISSNAQTIEDNKYTWVLTKDSNKNIEFSYEKKQEKESNLITVIVILLSIVVLGFVSLHIYRKFKEENKI